MAEQVLAILVADTNSSQPSTERVFEIVHAGHLKSGPLAGTVPGGVAHTRHGASIAMEHMRRMPSALGGNDIFRNAIQNNQPVVIALSIGILDAKGWNNEDRGSQLGHVNFVLP